MARSRGIYNETYTPELWEKVNQKNKDLLDDFCLEYTQRKKSKKTIEAYFQDIRLVLIHILNKYQNRFILDLTKKDFRDISIWLSEGRGGTSTDSKGRSNSRVNRIKSAMNSMLTFCEEDEDYSYNQNLAKKVRGLPKEPVKTDEDAFFFTFDEFMQVRNKLVEMGDLQCAVMWSLAFDSAARRNEVFQVLKHGLADGNKTNVVIGKRKKTFPLVYLDDTKELIRQYLEQRGEDNIDSLWINLVGKEKQEVGSEALYTRILKCAKILSDIRGEQCDIFFHSCRHSRVECLLNGEDPRLKNEDGTNKKFTLEQIQVFCHHSDVGTTQGYAKDHSEDTINNMFGIS